MRIVGHEWAISILKNALHGGRVSHAYLFTGPPQIGKTTLAIWLAQALNCDEEGRPCGKCVSCEKIERAIHPDVKMIDLAYQAAVKEKSVEGEEGKALGIESVRGLEADAALMPFEGHYKVFIIPEAERMTPAAANCLLKTLEEPPTYVVLVLTAADAGFLLPTIVSRSQVFNLRILPLEVITRELKETYGVDQGRAALLASLSGGKIGWAMEAARDEALLLAREERLEELSGTTKAGFGERTRLAERLGADEERAKEALKIWLAWWRDLLLVKGGCPERVENAHRREALSAEAQRLHLEEIMAYIKALQRTLDYLERNVNARLALEVLMLDLPAG